MDAANMTEEEKLLRAKDKKKGLTKEQREELAAFELERRKAREERVSTLASKLINYISVWTETDKGVDVTKAFKDKTVLEIENLKMESFGLEIMHAIGNTYLSKGTSFLKSHKSFLGLGGFWSRLKDKGAIAKETWGTISTAIDAQMTMEEMAKAEERGGEDWTDEKRAEYEKRVTGKILAAAWRGSKYEIQGVLREVCDKLLNDKAVKTEKRIERAQALIIVGELFQKVRCNTSRREVLQLRLRCARFPTDQEPTDISTRLNATPMRKAISWRSNSSWLRPNSRRTRRKRQSRTTRRRKSRICSTARSQRTTSLMRQLTSSTLTFKKMDGHERSSELSLTFLITERWIFKY